MAVKAFARQNGANVPIEIDSFLPCPNGREEAREEAREERKKSDKFVHHEEYQNLSGIVLA
jgi:hypothetical protein